MGPALEQARARAAQAAGSARLFVLPPPYARGHFRIEGAAGWTPDDWLICQSQGRSLFVTLNDRALLCAVREFCALPRVPLDAAASPLHTTLVQIARARADAEAGLDARTRLLVRLGMDVFAFTQNNSCRRVRFLLEFAQRPLEEALATALRRGGVPQTLRAPARAFAWGLALCAGPDKEEPG